MHRISIYFLGEILFLHFKFKCNKTKKKKDKSNEDGIKIRLKRLF